jgi:hypothetical protein
MRRARRHRRGAVESMIPGRHLAFRDYAPIPETQISMLSAPQWTPSS